MSNLKSTLFELFGDHSLVSSKYNTEPSHYYSYNTEKLHISIADNFGYYLVSVDFIFCFNKTSQSPIHFTFSEYKSLSKRKKNRIREAVNFLLKNEKDAETFMGGLLGFEDLGWLTRKEYYLTI